MPYINPEARDRVRKTDIASALKAGELNYKITMLVLDFLGPEPDYTRYAIVEGVLHHVAKELYRRSVAEYEALKASLNGDIPWPYVKKEEPV